MQSSILHGKIFQDQKASVNHYHVIALKQVEARFHNDTSV